MSKPSSELDDLILETFGKKGRSPGDDDGRGRSRGDDDDDPSDDEPMDSKHGSDNDDDSWDDDTGAGAGGSRRSASGSKMPLKKRFDTADKDDDDPNKANGYTSDVSYGSDLYKDDDDRERLNAMSMLDREMILSERADRRDAYLMRQKAASRLKVDPGQKRHRDDRDFDPPPPSAARSRSSVVRDSSKKTALHELVARRRRASDSDNQRRQHETPRKPSPVREKSRDSSGSSAPESSSSDNEGSDKETQDPDAGAEDDNIDSGQDLKFADVLNITIRRSKLAKWFLEPFFEEIIAGCFVRVGVGVRDSRNCYRLCQVKNVDARETGKNYKFENRTTHKWLNLVWGDSEARWQMARISDSLPTEEEFKQWEDEINKSDSRKPSVADILEKKAAIDKLSSFVYSAVLVKKMLQEKKMSLSRPSNVAAEKDRLLKELALAESKDDQDEVERIQSRLKDLEAYSLQSQSKDAKALALAQMNKRNRFENFKNASALKPANTGAKAGEAGYDPFSRRWTRSQNYYSRSTKVESVESTKASEAATVAAQEAAADAGKLVDTSAPVTDDRKLFSLHDFDLPISLHELQKFGGAQGAHHAFIARKQRLEATCGVPVENNDGRRHMLTLTVNDYKRRRGLL